MYKNWIKEKNTLTFYNGTTFWYCWHSTLKKFQWQESLTFHKEQIDIQNATIEKLREKFEEEKEINIDLILKLNDIEKQNTELTQALDAFKNIERTDCETQTIPENNDTNDAAEVKQEVIELE